jgi:hypothetical protein
MLVFFVSFPSLICLILLLLTYSRNEYHTGDYGMYNIACQFSKRS